METGEAEPVGGNGEEKASDEWTILDGEEHISDLLVTVAQLHVKMESLQPRKGSREEAGSSDLWSLRHFPSPAIPPPPALPLHCEEGRADLFWDVHKAVTSLEKTVSFHRGNIPSAEAELAEYVQVVTRLEQSLWKSQGADEGRGPEASEVLTGEASEYMGEIAHYRERNTAIRAALEDRVEELRKCEASLCAYQEDREKLQRKVKELKDSVYRIETLTDGTASPIKEGDAAWSPQGMAVATHNLLHSCQGALRAPPACCPFSRQAPAPTETHAEEVKTQQLHGSLEKLKGLNQLLSATLQACKGETERISMLLSRSESDMTALSLAAQCSERSLAAYEVLFSLSGSQQQSQKPPGKEGDAPGVEQPASQLQELKDEALRSLQSGKADRQQRSKDASSPFRGPEWSGSKEEEEDDDRKLLEDYIKYLRAEQASLKPPAHRPLPGAGSAAARINARIVAKMAEVQKAVCDTLPTETPKPRMEKAALLQELQAVREALADLNLRLHLTQKAKQGLELQTAASRAQEAACLLILQNWQEESRPQLSDSSTDSSGESGAEELALTWPSKGALSDIPQDAGTASDRRMVMLLHTLARNRELEDRIQSLLGKLEVSRAESKVQEMQQTELTRDFFKAHSALVLAYRNVRRKQEAQLHQLETQMTGMAQRQAGQLHTLLQTVQQVEGRAEGQAPVVVCGGKALSC